MDKDLEKFIVAFEGEKDAILRDVVKRVKNSLIRQTPVAEGEAVAEWDVGINRSAIDVKREPDPRKRTTRARLQGLLNNLKFGDTVFFENHDPVINRLERGFSKQAPHGMVRLTARKFRGFVRGAARAATTRIRKRSS